MLNFNSGDNCSCKGGFSNDCPLLKIVSPSSGHGLLKYVISEKFKKLIFVDDVNVIQEMIDKLDKNSIWYDFEGFSMPYPIVDNSLPFIQVPFQVSVIQTIGGIEQNGKTINFVVDPKTINISSLKEIVDVIYNQEADSYVVYNKSYENSRLKEIYCYIKMHDNDKNNVYLKKINNIISKTIDLADLFLTSSNKEEKKPPIFIPWMKGKYSIKIIEKFINEHLGSSPYIRHIKKYSGLKVQNGLMAMEMAIGRNIGVIGDNKWQDIDSHLKEYCENDVRAMIMVYDFTKIISKFIKNNDTKEVLIDDLLKL